MRSQQVILVALALSLSLATLVNAEKDGNAPNSWWNPFGSSLHLGTRLSAGSSPKPKQATPAKRATQERKLIERRSLASGCGDGWSDYATYDLSVDASKVLTCDWGSGNTCATTFSYQLNDMNDFDDIDIRVTDGVDCLGSVSLSDTLHYTDHFKNDVSDHSVYDQTIAGQRASDFCIVLTCDNIISTCDNIRFRYKMTRTCGGASSTTSPPSPPPTTSSSTTSSSYSSSSYSSSSTSLLLMWGSEDCASKCGLLDNKYYGSCGAFATKNDDNWCTAYGSEICCGASDADCCNPNGGVIAGVVIAGVVFLALSITACAFCCKCCCFKPAPAPAVMVATVPMGQVQPVMQPQVQMQPMQQMPPKQPV